MIKKALIIYDSVNFFTSYMKLKGYSVSTSFSSVNIIEKFFRKISLFTNINKEKWYGNWKNEIINHDLILIFATNRYDFIQYISDNFPEKRIIVWFWNPVFRCFDPKLLKKRNIEYWSFDREDCIKYKMNYNSTFYFDNIFLNQLRINVDVLFLGADKGRSKELLNIQKLITDLGLSTNFHIVPNKNAPNPKNIKFVNYSDYLDLIANSNVILDYLQEGQKGLSLRPMESIFLNKKLITNDLNIVKEDFYNENNIFILGLNDLANLKQFVHSPYFELDEKIVKKYDFNNWINRF